MTISPEAIDVLSRSTIVDLAVQLPDQLDRKLYVEVDKVLTNLGGKWNRKAKAHLFPTDPVVALATVLTAGDMPKHPDKVAAFFPTPPALAERMVDWAADGGDANGERWLEPSAGDGAIAAVVGALCPSVALTCIEPDPERFHRLTSLSVVAYRMTFEQFYTGHRTDNPFDPFHAVVMNPPFALPGAPLAWVDHVALALDLLLPGGRLAAVVPASVLFGQRAPVADLRKRLDWKSHTCDIEPLPEGTFRAAGTEAHTALILAETL